jgi:tetratricopeptide (TPR) repeat protein
MARNRGEVGIVLSAFILRPFGTKGGIDFDQVEKELVFPALSKLGISSRTSSEIAERGNIRIDIFERLLASDIVLADISVPNANVFYELGLAHALRDKRTVLMAAATSERRPFEMATDHYLLYDAQNASASIQQLVSLLQAVIQSDRVDSPVYMLLPGLRPPRPAILPPDFMSELEAASQNKDLGHLRLLSHEARSFHWAADALKNVGNAQFRAVDLTGARETFESVLSIAPRDTHANLRLGLLYQRLKEPRRADQAINRALESLEPDSKDRAEAFQLLGRNAKRGWVEVWRSRPAPEWRAEALRCPELKVAYDYYLKAFKQDLNQFYGGLDALALGTITIKLADELPLVWSELFENDGEADFRLSTLKKEVAFVAAGVALSLEAAGERHPSRDVWLEISRADFELLTSDRVGRVKERYRRAISDAPTFFVEAVLPEIYIYRDLGVLVDNAQAAIEALDGNNLPVELPAVPTTKRALLFVGHAIDAPGRASPRFPPSSEPVARKAILRAVEEEVKGDLAGWVGVAGASSGGDILFHEICESLGVADIICLAVPATEYARFGVVDAGPQWETRFRELIARQSYRVLSDSPELPGWLRHNAPYDFWDRDTIWRYHTAAALGDITVIALWDGKEGAASNLVRMAKERGAKIVVLDAVNILGVDASRQPQAAT